jgi:hypothetical protein
MGLLDDITNFFKPAALPTVQSVMPPAVISQITSGQLPNIATKTVFMKSGETCHYMDRAILLKDKVEKSYVRHNTGISAPGLFRTRVNTSGGRTNVEERKVTEEHKGVLYITNKRVIFSSSANAFDKPISGLSSCIPYKNAIELQYGSVTFSLLVADGDVVATVLNMVK